MNKSESEIHDIIDKRVNAVKNKDVEAATRDYSHDVILFDVVDPLERQGLDAVKSRLTEWFSTLAEIRDFEIRKVEIKGSETVAYCTSLNHIDAINIDGNAFNMWWRETTCYTKTEGSWKITHAHSSVPFNPATREPSLGLTPENVT